MATGVDMLQYFIEQNMSECIGKYILTEKEWKLREYKKWDSIGSARFKAHRKVDNPPERNGKMYEFKKWIGLAETPKQRAQRHLDDESYYKFSLISSIKDIIY